MWLVRREYVLFQRIGKEERKKGGREDGKERKDQVRKKRNEEFPSLSLDIPHYHIISWDVLLTSATQKMCRLSNFTDK